MLVQQHPDGDPAHVETIQKVLDVLADDGVRAVGLLVLHHSLGHGGNHVVVPIPDPYYCLCETETGRLPPGVRSPSRVKQNLRSVFRPLTHM